jgi:hypothetical protein
MFDCAGSHPYTAAQDSNIARKTVTRERTSKLFQQHHAFTRVLSLLLLGFIVWGTTIEAAHTHGSLAPVNIVVGRSHFSNPATESKATTNLTGCGDCLICQLHQNFSTALITFRLIAPPPPERARVTDQFARSFLSQTNAPSSGRAPPFIS